MLGSSRRLSPPRKYDGKLRNLKRIDRRKGLTLITYRIRNSPVTANRIRMAAWETKCLVTNVPVRIVRAALAIYHAYRKRSIAAVPKETSILIMVN